MALYLSRQPELGRAVLEKLGTATRGLGDPYYGGEVLADVAGAYALFGETQSARLAFDALREQVAREASPGGKTSILLKAARAAHMAGDKGGCSKFLASARSAARRAKSANPDLAADLAGTVEAVTLHLPSDATGLVPLLRSYAGILGIDGRCHEAGHELAQGICSIDKMEDPYRRLVLLIIYMEHLGTYRDDQAAAEQSQGGW